MSYTNTSIPENKTQKIIFISCGGNNAGDKYCSPHLFYKFNGYQVDYRNNWKLANGLKNNIIIFGGGGIIDTNKDRSNYFRTLPENNIYFHWGSGSNKLNLQEINWKPARNEINVRDDILKNFIFVGRRDYLDRYYNKHEYVPCVSCKIKHLQNSFKIIRRIGIIQHCWLKQIKNLNYPTISMDLKKHNIAEIIKFIGESEIIITGSFHAAYWGQLMQKKVIINGNWSSKFDTMKYKPVKLSNNIEDDIRKCIVPPHEYLKECIKLNDDFYMKIMNRIKKLGFITGEKIQFLCDHSIGVKENFKANPNTLKIKNKLVDIHNIQNRIDNKKIIFCYNTSRFTIDLLVKKLNYMKNPFKLVFHNTDKLFDKQHLILFEKLPLLERIYTQNMNVIHPRVEPLPIGLANSQWKHGNAKIHQEIYHMSIKKTKNIYFNFSKGTNYQIRNKCYEEITGKGIEWNKKLPYKEYLVELKKHKYAICPEGNGMDTHRFWECLYMKTIPICLKNVITQYYSNQFPVVVLDTWKELSLSTLASSYDVLYEKFKDSEEHLDMSSLLKRIKL